MIEKIKKNYFILIVTFLFLYFFFNLLDGERGLISFYEKKKMKDSLIQEKQLLINQLAYIEKKNSLLTNTIDIDFLETLYRKKFMYGRPDEKVYVRN